jgi:class 3 adenylate cyclase
MNLDKFNDMLLQSVGVGLAVLDPESLEVLFQNNRFEEWFPAVGEGSVSLGDLIPDVDLDRMRERFEKGRAYSTDTEVKAKRRSISLAVHLTDHRRADDEEQVVMMECHNISKIRELEYMIESYSKMVEKQNRSLEREKERAEKLLLNIMPKRIYEELKAFGVTTPSKFDEASVLMLDFVGFTEMAQASDPSVLIAELNDVFTAFDRISEQFGCERIKTIGDAYMAVCGVPEPTSDHAQSIARVALLFLHYLQRRNQTHTEKWECRIGIASGPVIGSIVGVQKYVYDIFGQCVNLASRMEELSKPMQITLPEEMRDLLKENFRFEPLGDVEVKGFGSKRLYSLLGVDEPVPTQEWRLPDF